MKTYLKKQMMTYIGAGFGLVIGLAWNNAITSLISTLVPSKNLGLLAQFIYALLLTVAIGVILYYANKMIEEETKEDEKNKTEKDKYKK